MSKFGLLGLGVQGCVSESFADGDFLGLDERPDAVQDKGSREKDTQAEDLDAGNNSGQEEGAELVRHVEVQPGHDDQTDELENKGEDAKDLALQDGAESEDDSETNSQGHCDDDHVVQRPRQIWKVGEG